MMVKRKHGIGKKYVAMLSTILYSQSYGIWYQGLDTGSKVIYLLNSIRYEKLSTAVAAVRAHPDKYEKDFDAVVAFLTH